ncbi:MAG: hypothetical protein ACR2GQ_10270 [Gemmatimonadota bacterium]
MLQKAIRADVHVRVDGVMGRLEQQVETIGDMKDLEVALEQALAEVADAMAEGIIAQMREAKRADRRGDTS